MNLSSSNPYTMRIQKALINQAKADCNKSKPSPFTEEEHKAIINSLPPYKCSIPIDDP
jgi:hypothetical protein